MLDAPVDLRASTSLLCRGGRELVRCDTQAVGLSPDSITAVHRLLLDRSVDDRGFRFGYVLGVDERSADPVVRDVVRELQDEIVTPIGHCRGVGFSLSFLKATAGPPPVVDEGALFAGLHLDTHPEITDDRGPELLRVLVNLSPVPRRFRFACIDRFELAARDAPVARSDFQVVDLPAGVEQRTVSIPAYDGRCVSYLTFWASLVPHVGVETGGGSFLASFETLASPEPTEVGDG